MKEQIDELTKLVEGGYVEDAWLLERLREILLGIKSEIAKELKPKKSGKFVELMDGVDCYLIRKKDISWSSFKKENFTEVNLYMKNKGSKTFNVSENQEVLENLISDFKG